MSYARWLSFAVLGLTCCQLSAVERPNERSALGVNLSGVVDWSTEFPFADVFRMSRTWISQADGKPWGQGSKLALTPEGWVAKLEPGQYATTLLLTHGGHPAGRYVCRYEGEGELQFVGNAKVASNAPGRIELDVSSERGLMLHLRRTNPQNPVRNIRVFLPGLAESDQTFTPAFLARYQPFRVIRFMDWMRTNDSKIREWAERPKLTDANQTERGVALELMIALANQLSVDPWFCLPHLASDDYVRQFAQQVKAELSPGLKVYIEHSNEVWNGQFAQARYAAEQGKTLKLSDNAYQAQLFYHSRRSVEIFKIWEEVFGGTERLVRVLGSQSANPWVSEQVIAFGDAHRHADAVAIAPYFGHSLGNPMRADAVVQMSLDEILAECAQGIAENRPRIEKTVQFAAKHGLDVIAYEGGQHLVGHGGAENNAALTEKLQAANRHPRMKQLYLDDLASWKAAGGRLHVTFSSVSEPSKWGSWGLLERESQDPATAPKYQAILEFLRTTPRWWD